MLQLDTLDLQRLRAFYLKHGGLRQAAMRLGQSIPAQQPVKYVADPHFEL